MRWLWFLVKHCTSTGVLLLASSMDVKAAARYWLTPSIALSRPEKVSLAPPWLTERSTKAASTSSSSKMDLRKHDARQLSVRHHWLLWAAVASQV
jgi:hypothetical protein